jgi:hypothetical protein
MGEIYYGNDITITDACILSRMEEYFKDLETDE